MRSRSTNLSTVQSFGSRVQTCVRTALIAAVIAAGTIACGAPPEGVLEPAQSLQRVRPRVVLDGLIELSARTGGRIFVDEVLIHAPDVELLDDGQSTSILETDPSDSGPLLFRYSADTGAAGASASAHQRTWDLSDFGRSPDSALMFSFAPFSADQDTSEELEARVGYEVAGLSGYTALVSGYVAVDAPGLGQGDDTLLYQASGDPDGAPARPLGNRLSGDPDGAPARPEDTIKGGETTSGDPDGAPASGDPDGAPASGDPDGAPASGDPDGAPASGDPDGAPASGDPDGAPADGEDDDDDDEAIDDGDDSTPVDMEHVAGSGDPDGAPASGDPDGAPASGDPDGAPADNPPANHSQTAMGGSFGPESSQGVSHRELRPFVIVFDTRFDLKIPAASVLHKDLKTSDGRTRVVPIDLHVDTDTLFSERVLELLEAVNAEQSDPSVPAIVILNDDQNSFNVEAEPPTEIPDEQETGNGGGGDPLMVTGDRRGNSED